MAQHRGGPLRDLALITDGRAMGIISSDGREGGCTDGEHAKLIHHTGIASLSGSTSAGLKRTGRLQQIQSNELSSTASTRGNFYRSVSAESDLSETDFDLRPLIREEIRNGIRKRRWQNGLLEWGMEDYDKKRFHNYELTPEDLTKREDRKKRNRLAAAKCRQKRRKRIDELEETMDALEKRRNELIRKKEFLSEEKQQLRKMVEEHFKMCDRSRPHISTVT